MDKLILGMSVEIMRSDGRVHGAIITSIREDNRGVSVEWYEKGETKGKEIDINALIKSNPKLFPTSNMPVPSVQTTKTNEIDKISIGMNVKIQRSNGRIQEAMITKINRETSCIAVEWFEMGETKGKDVDLKSLMRNNPDLFCPNIPMPDPSLTKKKNTQPGSQTSRQSIAVPQPQTSGSQTSRNSSILNPATTQQKQPELSIMDTTHSLDDLFDVEEEIKPIRRKTYDTRPAYSSKKVAISKLQNIFEEDIVAQEFNDIKENEPIIEPPPVMNKSRKSKSQLLNNIEELERNRELRRTQQGEVRKKREIQMQIDPGNPNWEFLSMIRDYQATIDYRPLRFNDPIVDNRICVCVRKRPFGKKEIANKEVEVVTVPLKDHVIVHQPQVKVDLTKYLVNQKFRFDYAFNEGASNELVYKFTAQPLVRTIFQRGFATCFAYGQTGSGKTHTMGGVIEGKHQDCSNGVYAMTANDVFVLLHSPEYRNEHLSVSCSFFEIYGTKVFDLLSKKATLRILEDGKHLVQVVGLREVKVHNVSEVLKLIKIGSDQRTAGQTSANSNSSRSHAVFQIILRKREKNTDLLYGKFSLIDLAGNERGADTISSDRQTRLEGGEINKSLLALKECIRAMGREEQHVPFRGSKLTLILRDSFVGKNAKTCMIAMISPGITCVENTMNTLRYADRVKELGSDLEQPEENGIAPSTSNK